MLWQLEQQQSEKVAEAEKSDKVEVSVIQQMKSKASFLLKFAGCVSVQCRAEVIVVFCHYSLYCNDIVLYLLGYCISSCCSSCTCNASEQVDCTLAWRAIHTVRICLLKSRNGAQKSW